MDAFTGEIRIFGFDFPPQYWAQCNGATMLISQYSALFTILGIQYGGDGKSTFALPNLRGSAVCAWGTGPGLTARPVGQTIGETGVSLLTTQMPAHQHDFTCVLGAGAGTSTNVPSADAHLSRTVNQFDFTNTDAPDTTLSPTMMLPTGNSMPHENRQPYLAMNFCICLNGEYPSKG